MGVHEDTLQGLHEALAYVKGDKTKGRSKTIVITDEKTDEIYCEKFKNLPHSDKLEAMKVIDRLYDNANA